MDGERVLSAITGSEERLSSAAEVRASGSAGRGPLSPASG